jgi:hypothetical protein
MILWLIFCSCYLSVITPSQQKIDFREKFGKDYTDAEDFLKSNSWINDSLVTYGVDPCIAVSVVFPEIIRFSSLRDKIETRALQTLYIQYGKYYSDFSIGHFQMKPSFAEKLEKEYLRKKGTSDMLAVKDTSDSELLRKHRVIRLSSLQGQVRYLAMFCIVMDMELKSYSADEKLRLISTAYNHGLSYKAEALRKAAQSGSFYTGLIPPTEKYIYAEISWDYFCRHCNQILPQSAGKH